MFYFLALKRSLLMIGARGVASGDIKSRYRIDAPLQTSDFYFLPLLLFFIHHKLTIYKRLILTYILNLTRIRLISESRFLLALDKNQFLTILASIRVLSFKYNHHRSSSKAVLWGPYWTPADVVGFVIPRSIFKFDTYRRYMSMVMGREFSPEIMPLC